MLIVQQITPIHTLSVQKKKKCTNLSRDRTPLLIPIGSRSHILRLGGWEKNSNPAEKKEKTLRNEKPDSKSTKTPKSKKKVALTWTLSSGAVWCPADGEVTLSRLRGMVRALQSTKGERKDIESSKSNQQDKEHSKKRTEDDEIDHERRRTSLARTCPKLNWTDLPTNGLTQLLFFTERRTTHRWKACLLADMKSSRSTVSEHQGQCKRYSNPARSSIHSKYRPRARTVQCKRGSWWMQPILHEVVQIVWSPW